MGKRGPKPRNQSGEAHEEEIVAVKRQNPMEVLTQRYFLRRPKLQRASSSQLKSPWKCINSSSNPGTVVEDETNVSLNTDIASQVLQPSTSPQPQENQVMCTEASSLRCSSPDINTSPAPIDLGQNISKCASPAGSRIWSAPISEDQFDLVNVISKISSQPQELQEIEDKRPEKSSTYIFPTSRTPVLCVTRDYVAVKNVNLENSSTNPIIHNRTQSLNITEFAKMLEDEIEDDPEEVQSDFDPAFGYVHEHKVKIEIVPLLTKIFDKYGDISRECTVRSSRGLSFAFESLCDVITKLTQTNFKDVTHIVLNEMLDDVRFLEENMKLNVGWLRERLESISQTKTGVQEYLKIKEDTAKYDASIARLDKELEEYQYELSQLPKKIAAVKRELVETEADADHSRKRALDIRTAVDTFNKSSLVHGLI